MAIGTPFATIQFALDKVNNRVLTGLVKIRVEEGDYSAEGTLQLYGINGYYFQLIAHSSGTDITGQSAAHIISAIHLVGCYAASLIIAGFTATITGSVPPFSVANSIQTIIKWCVSESTGSYGVSIGGGCNSIEMCLFSNKGIAIISQRGVVHSSGHTAGSDNTTGLVSYSGIIVKADGSQPQGATPESVAYGGTIV